MDQLPESSGSASPNDSVGSLLGDYVDQARSAMSAQITESLAAAALEGYHFYTPLNLPYTETTAMVNTTGMEGESTEKTPNSLDTGELFLKELTLSVFENEIITMFQETISVDREKNTIPTSVKESVKKAVKDYVFGGKKDKDYHLLGNGVSGVVVATARTEMHLNTTGDRYIAIKQIAIDTEKLFEDARKEKSPKAIWAKLLAQWRSFIAEIDIHVQAASLSEYVVGILGYQFSKKSAFDISRFVTVTPPKLFLNIYMKYLKVSLQNVIDQCSNDGQDISYIFRWQMLIQLLQALKLLHSFGIFHLDIKAANIMVEDIEEKYKGVSRTQTTIKDQPTTIEHKISYPFDKLRFLLTDFGLSKTNITIPSSSTKSTRGFHAKKGFKRSRMFSTAVLKESPSVAGNEDVQLLFCTLFQCAKGLSTSNGEEVYPQDVRRVFVEMANGFYKAQNFKPVPVEEKRDTTNTIGLTAFEIQIGFLVFGIPDSKGQVQPATSVGIGSSELLDYLLSRTPEGQVIVKS